MILKKRLFSAIFLLQIFMISQASAKGVLNPYDTIRYHEAFDQDLLYKKYEKLMHVLGCAPNVFGDDSDDKFFLKSKRYVYGSHDQGYIFEKQIIDEIERYQQDCLKRLNYARFMVLAEPGIESAMYIGFGGLAALAAIYLFGKESAGGSYSGYSAIFSAAYELNGLGKSLYNLAFPPNNSLDSLENYFAKNKCFIPKILWSKIINAFIDARQTDALKEKSINFLKFALGFTVYRLPIKGIFRSEHAIVEIKNELDQRIDRFFYEYSINEQERISLTHIKINVAKFIDALIDTSKKPPRYIYLHGLGGIGKTHFVQTLASWLEELMPKAIYYQDLVINSITELEGDENKPGAFLKILRNQTMENKIGSVVMIDEATWLNDHDMVSAAKRIFNGDRTRLSTAYFGLDVDGSAVALDMPPMLIFVASNEELADLALASRFDIVNYPLPTKETLAHYAYKIVQSSNVLSNYSSKIGYDEVMAWIHSIDFKNLNFRYIAGHIETYFLNKVLS
ncbi:ATP-binding protein [Candidatus Dependentiae bacterium]|nr:ATP-binding protein [Candidatus Dependentiae bacterium]